MTHKEIAEILKQRFPDEIAEIKSENVVDAYVRISPARWREIALYLRDDPAMEFDFLMCLSGMDYGRGILGAVYNIYSMNKKHKVNIKIEVPADAAEIPSVAEVWPTINWHEREAYDLIGIRFTGHPDPRRILMPYDWEGHPLRKDYEVPEFYHGMKIKY
jgi:NADH-quinone oxidoreductase subunit C